MNGHLRQRIRGGAALGLGLLAACATGTRELRDEGSERIEAAMRPEAHPDVIPEGITLGLDAPPLAPPEPEVADRGTVGPLDAAPGPWFYGPVPWVVPIPCCGSVPGPVRYHIEARPGGTLPGLLP